MRLRFHLHHQKVAKHVSAMAMDIDHSRPHRPHSPRALWNRSSIRPLLSSSRSGKRRYLRYPGESRIRRILGERFLKVTRSIYYLMLDSDSIQFRSHVPTPYLNAIGLSPRSQVVSQWWLSPQTAPLGRSEYLGLRQSAANDTDGDCLSVVPGLSGAILAPFRDMRNLQKHLTLRTGVSADGHRSTPSSPLRQEQRWFLLLLTTLLLEQSCRSPRSSRIF